MQSPAYGEGPGESLPLFTGPIFIWQLLQQVLDFVRELALHSVCPLSSPHPRAVFAFQVISVATT